MIDKNKISLLEQSFNTTGKLSLRNATSIADFIQEKVIAICESNQKKGLELINKLSIMNRIVGEMKYNPNMDSIVLLFVLAYEILDEYERNIKWESKLM